MRPTTDCVAGRNVAVNWKKPLNPEVIKSVDCQAADPDFITDLVMPSLGDDVKKKIMAGSSSFEWGGKTYELSKVGFPTA
jgi:hypothetical protein